MSRWTAGVAVAVKAWIGRSGRSARIRPICRYSGRKSCPQWLMQCASSTARELIPSSLRRSMKPGIASRSGAT